MKPVKVRLELVDIKTDVTMFSEYVPVDLPLPVVGDKLWSESFGMKPPPKCVWYFNVLEVYKYYDCNISLGFYYMAVTVRGELIEGREYVG